ncbi:hypothetical protein PVA23_39 [Vibrio phage PVA23]|nr:hypothetical protein PVA23_39 [Vibrio phage PVA23]
MKYVLKEASRNSSHIPYADIGLLAHEDEENYVYVYWFSVDELHHYHKSDNAISIQTNDCPDKKAIARAKHLLEMGQTTDEEREETMTFFQNKVQNVLHNATEFANRIKYNLSEFEQFDCSEFTLTSVVLDEDGDVCIRFDEMYAGGDEGVITYSHNIQDFWDAESTVKTIQGYIDEATERDKKMKLEQEREMKENETQEKKELKRLMQKYIFSELQI